MLKLVKEVANKEEIDNFDYKIVKNAVESLPPREKYVVNKYRDGKTLAQIAQEVKVSPTRIRQLKNKALSRLKNIYLTQRAVLDKSDDIRALGLTTREYNALKDGYWMCVINERAILKISDLEDFVARRGTLRKIKNIGAVAEQRILHAYKNYTGKDLYTT